MLKWIKDLLLKLMGLKYIQYIPKHLDLKYFKNDLSEFDSPDEVGSGSKMDSKFLEKLDYARGNVDGQMVFKINSAYRSEKWNLKCGGRWGSSHKKGLAVDIAYNGSRERYLLVNALMQIGINRIGISKSGSFVHADVDKSKDPDVIWLY